MTLSKKEIEYARNIIGIEYITKKSEPYIKKLRKLKEKEPTSDKPFFRLAIIGYELAKSFGSIERAIVYAERFRNNPELYRQELKNAQLEIGDSFVQLILLCQTYNFDIWETLELGTKHLEERYKDFEDKGWTEV